MTGIGRTIVGMLGCGAALVVPVAASARAAASSASTSALPDAARVLALAEKVADWQLGQGGAAAVARAGAETRSSRGWQQAAFYVGLTELAERSAAPRFRQGVIANGVNNGWRLGDRPYHADDQAIGQSCLWAARHGGPTDAAAAVRARFDAILAAPPAGSLNFRAAGDVGEGGCQRR